MKVVLQLTLAFLGLWCCNGLSAKPAFTVLDRYNEMVENGQIVEQKMQTYITTSPSEETLRKKRQEEFFDSFDSKLKFKYEWLVNTLLLTGYDSLKNILSATMIKNRPDLSKMNQTMNDVKKEFKFIGDIRTQYLSDKTSNAIVKLHLDQMKKVQDHLTKEIKLQISHYKNVLWQEFYHQDIQTIISKTGSARVDSAIVQQMSKNYPFRSWFAYMYNAPTHIPRRTCFESRPNAFFKVNGKELYVIPGPLSISQEKKSSATSRLALVKNDGWSLKTRCDRLALQLYTDMRYSCNGGENSHAFSAVLPYDDFNFSVSNKALLAIKSVKRHSPVIHWCNRRYQVIVFA